MVVGSWFVEGGGGEKEALERSPRAGTRLPKASRGATVGSGDTLEHAAVSREQGGGEGKKMCEEYRDSWRERGLDPRDPRG